MSLQKSWVPSIIAILFGLFISACEDTRTERPKQKKPIVMAGGETLSGQRDEHNINSFVGIPFAAAPVGNLRWEAAQLHLPRAGHQDATRFGPACPQSQGNPQWYRMLAKGFGGDPSVIPDMHHMDENCLYLNVWTPSLSAKSKLPIMIWVHGGSNINGWAYEPNYIGNKLAAKGVVVVSVQYRMGSLGFLPLPFGGGHSGNYGLSDLMAAIEWTRDNATSFGGDPHNITLFGESAGGGNINALMKSPRAENLFQKAIIQSGALGLADYLPLKTAMTRSKEMFKSIGVTSQEQARALPWHALVDLHKKTDIPHYHSPVVDDVYVRANDQLNAGIDLLIGSNLNEMLMYLDGTNPDLVSENLANFPLKHHDALRKFLKASTLTPLEQADLLSTASAFHCPALALADAAVLAGDHAYLYRFTRKRDLSDKYGAYHGAEIPYIFNTHDDWLPTEKTDRVLSEIMMKYWVNFARSGNPNDVNLPQWPHHTQTQNQIQTLGDKVKTTTDFAYHLCDYLHDKD